MTFIRTWNYCPQCGDRLKEAHDGEKLVPSCPACRIFFYSNPVPCVTTVLETEEGILHILRGKEPKKGWWALPGGFLDIGESPEEGAKREFLEETGLEATEVSLIGLTAQHSDRFGSVIYVGYEVLAYRGDPTPGSDAVETRFFPREDRPPLAFNSLVDIMDLYLSRAREGRGRRHP
ncbi:MAG: NUDIX hydrolase [Planctomycetota bacterium]|jgi:ADP-ribose pyrophosphatase YjhB (NUDIX family)